MTISVNSNGEEDSLMEATTQPTDPVSITKEDPMSMDDVDISGIKDAQKSPGSTTSNAQRSPITRCDYKLQYSLQGHSKSIASVKFSPDGLWLATAGTFFIWLWNIMAFSDDSMRVAADATIKLWNVKTGQFEKTLQGHSEGISDVAWSADSKLLCSASDDKTIRIWNVETVHEFFVGDQT